MQKKQFGKLGIGSDWPEFLSSIVESSGWFRAKRDLQQAFYNKLHDFGSLRAAQISPKMGISSQLLRAFLSVALQASDVFVQFSQE